MKATLEFNLPEDDHAYKVSSNAHKYYTVLCELSEWLRTEDKYAETRAVEWDVIRTQLYELLNEEGVTLE